MNSVGSRIIQALSELLLFVLSFFSLKKEKKITDRILSNRLVEQLPTGL
jgi:hypothetical protein